MRRIVLVKRAYQLKHDPFQDRRIRHLGLCYMLHENKTLEKCLDAVKEWAPAIYDIPDAKKLRKSVWWQLNNMVIV